MLYGFENAQTNFVPLKDENGKLKWVRLHSAAFSGNINELIQSEGFTLYGGSADLAENFISNGFNVSMRLRRDNDYNYNKIKDTFIPQKGEICLVDTAREGLKAVCGDGETPFGQLEYINEFIVKGYYHEDNFYKDRNYELQLTPSPLKLYIDLSDNGLYHHDGNEYIAIGGGAGGKIPSATATVPGIMKLYNTVGQNEDGTMTQKAITDELDDKVEVSVNLDEELLIFTN